MENKFKNVMVQMEPKESNVYFIQAATGNSDEEIIKNAEKIVLERNIGAKIYNSVIRK